MNSVSLVQARAGHLEILQRRWWRWLQAAFWGVGATILALLILAPEVGLQALWNVLIPVAPALLALLPGVWRNVCPLATTTLLPRRAGVGGRRRLSPAGQARMALAGTVALLVIVPLRNAVLDLDGPATALTLIATVAAALLLSLVFEGRSGWCNGPCPVHAVEKLYASAPLLSVANAHCTECTACTAPCPDSTRGMHPMLDPREKAAALAGTVMVGGFAGFVWGWFHVPKFAHGEGWANLDLAYGYPLGGLAISLAGYLTLRRMLPAGMHGRLDRAFAAGAIGCYYWYRIPALFGFGLIPGDGMLVDLRGTLAPWFPALSHLVTTAFFAWWLVWRASPARSWSVRPPVPA